MKQYKTVVINFKVNKSKLQSELEGKLNEMAQQGWILKEVVSSEWLYELVLFFEKDAE